MSQLERWLSMAEDELTQYSTDARKVEKIRQKMALALPLPALQQLKADLLAERPTDGMSQAIRNQRQAVALPFWGIAGLGLLCGISFMQPLDFLGTILGGAIAIAVQRRGWKLQAQDLLLKTIEDLEERIQNPQA